jgi:hypothetical protein
MSWIHRVSMALGLIAGATAIITAARYALGPFLTTPEQPYFQLLPVGWLIIRVVHFALVGSAEFFAALRPASATRTGALIALALLLAYQGYVAAINLSVIETPLFFAGIGAILAAALAVVQARAVSSFWIGLTASVFGFVLLVVLYGLFPLVP